ncbi:MAG TPA: hypothetical protein VMV94_13165 [Phycisphaerae bacterium]|nr:hypothetical protein [Phycisphaerae bacterium]
MKTKTLDCVAMKRAAQKKIREAVKGMTPAQEIEFFREGEAEFERQIESAKRSLGSKSARA